MKTLVSIVAAVCALCTLASAQASYPDSTPSLLSGSKPVAPDASSLSELERRDEQIRELDIIHARLVEAATRMAEIYSALNERLDRVCGPNDQRISPADTARALEELCLFSLHDTLEHLELESHVQRQSVQFNALIDSMNAWHESPKRSAQNLQNLQ